LQGACQDPVVRKIADSIGAAGPRSAGLGLLEVSADPIKKRLFPGDAASTAVPGSRCARRAAQSL
jgi:hypothetical protein